MTNIEVANTFIGNLIAILKKQNKSLDDICFMVAPLYNSLYKSSVFINDICSNNYSFTNFNDDETGGYTNGDIGIIIHGCEKEKTQTYNMYFQFEDRPTNYCMCNSNQHGYNEKKKCCGINCDWTAPKYILERVDAVMHGKWRGLEKDYWDFEKSFMNNEGLKDLDHEREQREMKKKELQEKIKLLEEQLKALA